MAGVERAGLVGVAAAECDERGAAEEEKDASALGIRCAAVAATMDP